MRPIDRILAPIDEGPPSAVSLRYAAMISKALEAQLTAVHVIHELMSIPMLEERWVTEIECEKQEIADTVSEVEEEFGMAIRLKVLEGIPIRTILRESETGNYDLIVAGSRGKKSVEEFISGAFSRELVLHSAKPVLIARSTAQPKRVLICTDGSEYSDAVIEYAGLIAERTNAETKLTYSRDMFPSAADAARVIEKETGILAAHHVVPRTAVVVRSAASQIIKAANEFGADLIVMGWKKAGKISLISVGDLVLAVLHKTNRSLLVHRRRYPESIWY